MSEVHDVTFNLNIDIDETRRELQRLTSIIFRYLGLMRRSGLPEDINVAMQKIQKLITTLHMLQATLIAVQAASGPIGWLGAGAGILATVYGVADLAADLE